MERNNSDKHLKIFSVLVALIIAIVGWVYVVYNYDPMTRVTYTEVPISFVGEDVLADKGYAVAKTSTDSIYVVLNQRRIDSSKIDADDITVVADVSEAVEGKNGISLGIMGPEGTQLVESEVRSISVDVEKAERVEVGIEVVYMDESEINTEPIATNLTSNTATVIGAESSITKVDKAVAYVGYSDTAEGVGVFTRDLTAVDGNRNVIPHMVIYPGTVNFSAEQGYLKSVKLNVNVVDESNDNYERKYSAPDTITIKGSSEAIATLTSVDTEEINITGVYEDMDIDIRCIMPEGIYPAYIAKNLKLHVTLTEKPEETDNDNNDNNESDVDG